MTREVRSRIESLRWNANEYREWARTIGPLWPTALDQRDDTTRRADALEDAARLDEIADELETP